MKRILNLIFLLQLVFTLAGEARAQDRLHPSLPPSPSQSPKEEHIQIFADHIIQGSEKEEVLAWGRVKVQYQDRTLWADKVRINNKTGLGHARGHVIFTSEDGTRMKARESLFDMKSKRGKSFKAKGIMARQFYITGREIERLTKDRFLLDDASLTTCEGALPDWSIEAEFADVIKGDRALFRKAIVKVRDIPVLYLPMGYIPINQERKTGFLMPTFGWSDVSGVLFKSAFFWAINKWSDATVYIERQVGGTQPSFEFRYTPMPSMRGQINASFIDDDVTKENLWKVDMIHNQEFSNNFIFKGRLDLESQESFNEAINDEVNLRTRNNTNSFATLNRNWSNSSLDILARFQENTDRIQDDTLGELPKITYKVQQTQIGESPFYFSLDTSSAWFLTDLNPMEGDDSFFKTARVDFHPRLSVPIPLAPWISITPTIGAQETLYSRGLRVIGTQKNKLPGFTRESFNFSTSLVGPKINKVYSFDDTTTKIKHLIEPGFTYNFTPDIDEEDRLKIKKFDAIDSVGPANTVSYSLGQRLLKKVEVEPNKFETHQILRFTMSQSYDIREATIDKKPGDERLPFSQIRFDLDSRPLDSLLMNFDATYDHVTDLVNTVNFEAGIKPVDNFWIILERRWTRDGSNFMLGTLDLSFKPGWHVQYSTRFDELTSTFRENNFSLMYDNPCKCWGFSFDIIDRQVRDVNNRRRDETKFLWNITLRGLGDLKSGGKPVLLHRDFEDKAFPDTSFRSKINFN
ncbi:hypothetical protein UR09_02680 [Candidatus Nitromaritima sp. SCGC AAA799-A02]|nr:hypothetical protein UR09_02680 [Candidatus Nitromaritima sp. SCGC AAA799-A02]KMP11882.1 hypothetical protein UZ36_02900 [Candidatus Nitromaritima sp. SCGC AAA799-C22]